MGFNIVLPRQAAGPRIHQGGDSINPILGRADKTPAYATGRRTLQEALGAFAEGGGSLGQERQPLAQFAAIGDDLPIVGMLELQLFQHGGKIAVAWLAEAMVEDHRSDRGEMDAHPRQHAQEGAFHHRGPI